MIRFDDVDRDTSDFQIADQGPCNEQQPSPFTMKQAMICSVAAAKWLSMTAGGHGSKLL